MLRLVREGEGEEEGANGRSARKGPSSSIGGHRVGVVRVIATLARPFQAGVLPRRRVVRSTGHTTIAAVLRRILHL